MRPLERGVMTRRAAHLAARTMKHCRHSATSSPASPTSSLASSGWIRSKPRASTRRPGSGCINGAAVPARHLATGSRGSPWGAPGRRPSPLQAQRLSQQLVFRPGREVCLPWPEGLDMAWLLRDPQGPISVTRQHTLEAPFSPRTSTQITATESGCCDLIDGLSVGGVTVR